MNGRWNKVEQAINRVHNTHMQFVSMQSVSGGCINRAWKMTDSDGKHWFVKENSLELIHMFEAEADGLQEISKSNSIRIPEPVCYGQTGTFSYLVLEYIPMQASIKQQKTGEQLACMHQYRQKKFGWHRDNTIGSTPQSNDFHTNWIAFWKTQRLLYQLELAHSRGYPDADYENGLKLANALDSLFSDYHPVASLLHGDLWGGNCASDARGNPLLFDPATYFGDRETDIAMTELFGGFNSAFYAAYNAIYPLDAGYKTRKTLYNLYHILNHYNLFGGGYASQAGRMTAQLLAEMGQGTC